MYWWRVKCIRLEFKNNLSNVIAQILDPAWSTKCLFICTFGTIALLLLPQASSMKHSLSILMIWNTIWIHACNARGSETCYSYERGFSPTTPHPNIPALGFLCRLTMQEATADRGGKEWESWPLLKKGILGCSDQWLLVQGGLKTCGQRSLCTLWNSTPMHSLGAL